jgi:hypothetical protein
MSKMPRDRLGDYGGIHRSPALVGKSGLLADGSAAKPVCEGRGLSWLVRAELSSLANPPNLTRESRLMGELEPEGSSFRYSFDLRNGKRAWTRWSRHREYP